MGKTANIKFNGGIIHTPSDVSPVDGDLNECINLVPSDGELKPLEMPQKIFPNGGVGGVVAAIHKGTWGKHFIKVHNYNNTIWFLDENMQFIKSFTSDSAILWVQCLGTYVCVGTENDIIYFQYKNGGYLTTINPHPIEIDFRPSDSKIYQYKGSTTLSITDFDGITKQGIPCVPHLTQDTMGIHVSTDNLQSTWQTIIDHIKTQIVTTIMDTKRDKRFVFPFYVMYAIKLKTGKYIMQSRPILILPSTDKNPILMYYACDGESYGHTLTPVTGYYYYPKFVLNPKIAISASKLQLRINSDDLSWLRSSDEVESVDIFLSLQHWSYNESNMTTSWLLQEDRYIHPLNNADDDNFYGETHSMSTEKIFNKFASGVHDQKIHIDNATVIISSGNIAYYVSKKGRFGIDLPSTKIEEKLLSDGNFYKIKSIKPQDFYNLAISNGDYFDFDFDEDDLINLETQPGFDNATISYSKLCSRVAGIYNSRLVLANINKNDEDFLNFSNYDTQNFITDIELKFLISSDNNQQTIHISGIKASLSRFIDYIYAPYNKCQHCYMKVKINNIDTYYKVDMTQHDSLNGTYYFNKFKDFQYFLNNATPIQAWEWNSLQDTNSDSLMPNLLMMSDTASPMSYNINNAVEVGAGDILNVAANTIPMSEGQYGQYPLIVFTNSGIHAVGISNDGSFTGISLVSSSDTLMGSPGLGQPNVISDGQSLYFITKRGLMEMRGLQVRCVSEVLNGGTWKYSDYRDCANPNQGKVQYQNIVMLFGDGIKNSQTFNQAVSDPNNPAFLAFDYKHNRILVTNPSLRAHWLYSITDHKWCKMIFNDNYKVDDKSAIQNISQMMSSGLINVKNPNDAVDGRDIVSAVFDWNASYLQTSDGELWDLMGAPDENDDAYYKYGFIASRPIRLGSDEHKSIIRLLHRERINSQYGFRGMRLYGSVDGIRFYEITSLRGASYKYFVVLIYTCMKANERYSYMSVEFDEKFQNKLR